MRNVLWAVVVMFALAGSGTPLGAAQSPPDRQAPSNPGVVAPPTWSRMFKLPDGRTFVTDGAMVIDAAVAKPATLPTVVLDELIGKNVNGYLTAQYATEIAMTDLKPGPRPNTVQTPGGIVLNGNYTTFLGRAVSPARLRLRANGDRQPVLIVLDGKAVGVLMPVAR